MLLYPFVQLFLRLSNLSVLWHAPCSILLPNVLNASCRYRLIARLDLSLLDESAYMNAVVGSSGSNLSEFSTRILKLPTSMFSMVLLAIGWSTPIWPI